MSPVGEYSKGTTSVLLHFCMRGDVKSTAPYVGDSIHRQYFGRVKVRLEGRESTTLQRRP